MCALCTISAKAQTETSIGGLIAYGTEVESIGIGANAEFPIIENLTVSPSFIYYFPKDEVGVKINWFEINANANYYFVNQDNLGVYGLAGLNYSSINVKLTGAAAAFGQNLSASDGSLGINLGGGANFELNGGLTLFSELRYVVIDRGQLVLAAGVRFKI